METVRNGTTHLFGKNVDTDQIYPGRYLEVTDPKEIGTYCLSGARENFAKTVQSGDFVVAGVNFGCGSSREHAAIALKESGVSAVIAESYGRIFYRNAINLGLPVLVCKNVTLEVSQGDSLEVDIKTGELINHTKNKRLSCEPLPEFIMNILNAGGIKSLYKSQMGVSFE